jgi:hypothetical protein
MTLLLSCDFSLPFVELSESVSLASEDITKLSVCTPF